MTAPPVNGTLDPIRVELLADGRVALFPEGGAVQVLLPSEAWQVAQALEAAATMSEGVAVAAQHPRRAVCLTFQLPEDGND